MKWIEKIESEFDTIMGVFGKLKFYKVMKILHN